MLGKSFLDINIVALWLSIKASTKAFSLKNVSTRIPGGMPDLHLNMKILFSAHFNPLNYVQALKYLSEVINFFQAKPVFEQSNSPGLVDTNIQKLNFNIYHQDTNVKNNLWATLGAKYMPSISYHVRLITITDQSVRQQIDGIKVFEVDDNAI